MLPKWLQCETGRYCLLLSHYNKIAYTLSPLVLLHRVQDLCIHYPSECWLISCFFSAVRLLNMPMAVHNHSKVNHKVLSRLRRRHRRLSLPPPQRPRDLLLLIPRHVQQPRSHDPFHCGLDPCFFSAVHLPHMQCYFFVRCHVVFLFLIAFLFFGSLTCKYAEDLTISSSKQPGRNK
ncbi:hypothetical protein EDB19DRAFT_839686 [Suillus lakei]|nr:hypothetical protein EDB19DRAFT_839686 [Suillus lakei]